jgi:hypothetical protein
MGWPGKPKPVNPKLTDMALPDDVTWCRQNMWAGWIANCNAKPGMRENTRERMLAGIASRQAPSGSNA